MSTLTNFKAQLIGGGARQNLFSVSLAFPTDVSGGFLAAQRSEFLVKGASLPGSTISPIEVAYRGRKLKIAGDRQFAEPWQITVINDTNMDIRNAFEDWMHRVTRHDENTSVFGNNLNYMATASISQLDREGNPGKTYTMYDVWPSSIAAIELNYENEGIQEFTVELQYQHWESDTTVA